jgi:hypothetical protein
MFRHPVAVGKIGAVNLDKLTNAIDDLCEFLPLWRRGLRVSPAVEDFSRGGQRIPFLPGNNSPGVRQLTRPCDQGECSRDPLFLCGKVVSEPSGYF